MKKTKNIILILFAITLLAVAVNADCPSGMVSYWTFDDADVSGNNVIDSFGNNDGTNNGATTGVTGQVGEAFSFDGNNN